MIVPDQRYRRGYPCPICSGYREMPQGKGKRCWGHDSPDGKFAVCTRDEFAGQLTRDGDGYCHTKSGTCRCGAVHGGMPSPVRLVRPAADPYVPPAAPVPVPCDFEPMFVYRYEDGTTAYAKYRTPAGAERRWTTIAHQGPDGTWYRTMGGAPHLLYRLPELIASHETEKIYITEGERDADTAASLGLVATTSGGAQSWPSVEELAHQHLRGRHVVILPDNDAEGHKYREAIERSLHGVASRIEAFYMPDGHKDLSDAIAAGVTLEQIFAASAAPDTGTHASEFKSVTDAGNSELFIAQHADDIRHVGTWKKWLTWDGRRWDYDETGQVHERAKATAESMLAAAESCLAEAKLAAKDSEDPRLLAAVKQAKSTLSWAIGSNCSGRLAAMVSLSASVPSVAVRHGQLDADEWLLNVKNGTVDLRTGKLQAVSRSDLITRVLETDYDPAAQCPMWKDFLIFAMGGDHELVSYLQRFVGYSLTGSTADHVLAFLYGDGANGKSTFVNLIHELAGDYGARAPRNLLFKSAQRHETELTTLFSKRFVSCAEIDAGAVFDEALVKDLTGGDPITARRMREDHWTFRPTHKLTIAGNHKPVVRGTDHGIWRRMKLIPWTVTVPPDRIDPNLGAKLRSELPGILAWAVRGAMDWQQGGLRDPAAVREATEEYRLSSDPVRDFLDSRCVFQEGLRITRARLRKMYELFCEEIGATPVHARRFAEALRRRGVVESNVRDGEHVRDGWGGIGLKGPLPY